MGNVLLLDWEWVLSSCGYFLFGHDDFRRNSDARSYSVWKKKNARLRIKNWSWVGQNNTNGL